MAKNSNRINLPYSVYISSTGEFKEIREKIRAEIKKRGKLYEVNSMEDYTAEDLPAVVRCRRDVANCDIYVCIWGYRYGSVVNDGKGLSFTHHEFEEASEKKIQRLIFFKMFPPGNDADDHVNLIQLKDKINNQDQLLVQKFSEDKKLPVLILTALDNYVASFKDEIEKRQHEREEKSKANSDNYNKIFLCDRTEVSDEFLVSIDEDPIQFFVLKGHENDLPHYFVKRMELEFEDRDLQWKSIVIRPSIPDTITDFDKAENYIKTGILNELKWPKFKLPKNVTPEGVVEYMTEKNIDYLSVSWFIESALWKNDTLKEFIISFYQKYNQINQTLKTDKRIFFFGILRYAEDSAISEEEFNERIKSIRWEYNLQKFIKIKKNHLKDWLMDNDIEHLNSTCEELIARHINEINERDMYYSEVENGLKKILDDHNKKKL